MIFSELGQVSVAWRKTSSQPTGSVNSTPTTTARTELPAQHDHMSPREHDWLKSCKAQDCTSLCLQNHCPPRVMSRPLPHRTLTTSTSSLSPVSSTSPTFPTVSPLHTDPWYSTHYFPCDVPRQSGGSTQIPISHRIRDIQKELPETDRCHGKSTSNHDAMQFRI